MLVVSASCAPSDSRTNSFLQSDYELVQTRRLGTMDGPEAFGILWTLAAHSTGVLGAFDRASCEIVLIDTDLMSVIRRVGGCGQGPGELGITYSFMLTGDSIFVVDPNAGGVKVLDHYGNDDSSSESQAAYSYRFKWRGNHRKQSLHLETSSFHTD